MKRTLLTLAICLLDFSLHADPLASWSSQDSGTTNILYDVNFIDGAFVAVGDSGTLLTSSDGITWVSLDSGTTNTLTRIIFKGGKYVVSGFGGMIMTSPDLIAWAQQSTGTPMICSGLIMEILLSPLAILAPS